MARVKRGVGHVKRRKNLLSHTKGMMWGRKKNIRMARTAFLKAGAYSYRDRRNKKRDFRRLWQIRINAAARMHGLSYSKFIHAIKVANVELDRKILAAMAAKYPVVFEKIVDTVKK